MNVKFIHLFTFRSQRIQSFIDGIKSVNELVLNELVSSNLHHLHTHTTLYSSRPITAYVSGYMTFDI